MQFSSVQFRAACTLLVGCVFLACGDDGSAPATDDGSGSDPLGLAPFDAPGPVPVRVASTRGCRTDVECAAGRFCFAGVCSIECEDDGTCRSGEVCSERGRCVVTAGQKDRDGTPAVEPRTPEVEIVRIVEPTITIPLPAEGESVGDAVFEVELNQSLGEAGAPYRLTRSDSSEGSDVVYRAFTAEDGATVRIVVPAGAADPTLDSARRVDLQVISSFGTFALSMAPERPITGVYSGVVYIPEINAQLPIEAAVLEGEDGGYLLGLPVGDDQAFRPRDQFDEVSWSVRALRENAFGDGYVATFDEQFNLPADSLFAPFAAATNREQVGRALRLEIELGDERIVGRINDRWVGLLDAFNEEGFAVPRDVTLEGTVELRLVGSLADYDGPTSADEDAPARPEPLPRPTLAECAGIAFPDVAGCATGGDPITSVATFESATVEAAAACAVAVTNEALSPSDGAVVSISSRLAAFLSEGGDTGGLSFEEFMAECATGDSDVCRPTPLLGCARALSAHALRDAAGDLSVAEDLASAYHEATRESLLGQQLGAFFTDDATRLEWLSTQDFPALVTSAVRDVTAQLLDEWEAEVLDVHFDVLAGYLDVSGISVLGYPPTSDRSRAIRRQLLTDIAQGWQGAMGSLTTAAIRWNDLYEDDADRQERSRLIAERSLDLYLSAAVLTSMNRSADVGYLNAAFGNGFAVLGRVSRSLSLPFNQLVYARDAEVAVSRSVDPLATNQTLLSAAEERAVEAIELAAIAVTEVLDTRQAEALSETQLRNRMNNEIEDLRRELVLLCGLPVGCSESDIDNPNCAVAAVDGVCGFIHSRGSTPADCPGGAGVEFSLSGQSVPAVYLCPFDVNTVAVSEAGQTLIALLESIESNRQAFASAVAAGELNALRIAEADALQLNLTNIGNRRTEVSALYTNTLTELQAGVDAGVNEIIAAYNGRRQAYDASISEGIALAEKWADWREDDIDGDMHLVRSISAFERLAATTSSAREYGQMMTEAFSEGFPKLVGVAGADLSAPLRLATLTSGATAAFSLRAVEQGFLGVADTMDDALQERRARNEAELTADMDRHAVDEQQLERDLLEFEEALAISAARGDGDTTRIQVMLEQTRADVTLAIEYEQARAALKAMQIEVQQGLAEWARLESEAVRAEIQYAQRLNEYLMVVQRASLLNAKYAQLTAQRVDINQLVGSPSSFFGRANELVQAENRLESAKRALMDWLVTLEYAAVRPFIDERVQILLARNHYQLSAIAGRLSELQDRCGGPISERVSTVSLRDDLLRITQPIVDDTTGEAFDSQSRFRELLRNALIPLDKRVRYTSNSTIGDLLRRPDSILAAVFRLSLGDFANLAATCNAKIRGFRVQLVGDIGEGQPTVTLLYDGAAELRSCQPGIDDYVESVAPGVTAFGSISVVSTQGRGASPVAGINAFPPDDFNLALDGLPLASEYTIVVDTELGENARFDWDALEDVLIEFSYQYQDPFPEGQCN